ADESSDRCLPDPGALRDRREAVQRRADRPLVAEHVVRDLEHGEGRDPRGESREPHQRQPDHKREGAADHGRESEGRDIADVRGDEEVSEARKGDRLLDPRHSEHAGGPRTDGDEADLPERQDARVADEDVEPDDDRNDDQRLDEVPLEVARDREPEQRGRHDEQRGDQHLEQAPSLTHTRSTVPPPRVKRPFGRTSKTTITAAKMKLVRYCVLSAGSPPPRMRVAKPIEKPPRVAGIGRFIPPTTTPASTMIVSWRPNVDEMLFSCTLRNTAEVAASSPEMITAAPI